MILFCFVLFLLRVFDIKAAIITSKLIVISNFFLTVFLFLLERRCTNKNKSIKKIYKNKTNFITNLCLKHVNLEKKKFFFWAFFIVEESQYALMHTSFLNGKLKKKENKNHKKYVKL